MILVFWGASLGHRLGRRSTSVPPEASRRWDGFNLHGLRSAPWAPPPVRMHDVVPIHGELFPKDVQGSCHVKQSMSHLGILKYQSLPAARGRELILRIVRIHGACCLEKSRIYFLHLESFKFNVISMNCLKFYGAFLRHTPWLRKLYTRPKATTQLRIPHAIAEKLESQGPSRSAPGSGRSSESFPMKRKSLRLQPVGPRHPCQWTMVVPKSAQQKPHGQLEKKTTELEETKMLFLDN